MEIAFRVGLGQAKWKISLKSSTDEIRLGEVHGVPNDEGGPGRPGSQHRSAWAELPGNGAKERTFKYSRKRILRLQWKTDIVTTVENGYVL